VNQQAWATEEGTASYRNRFAGKVGENHFRHQQGLWMSSIGIGTYLGSHDDSTDDLYRQAVVRNNRLWLKWLCAARFFGLDFFRIAVNYSSRRCRQILQS